MKREIIITNVRDTFAFGITTDTYEQVYIPRSIVSKFDLEPDDEVDCIIIPNANDHNGNVPWFATFIVDAGDDEDEEEAAPPPPPAPKLNVKDAVYNVIAKTNRIFASSDVAEEVNKRHGTDFKADNISAYLDSLHGEGKVARAMVNQTKSDFAKYSLWAHDLNTFTNLRDA